MDIIITVCDQAAGEQCPYWPGHPMTAHWGVADPAAATGSETEKRHAFSEAYDTLKRRISALVALPINACDEPTLRRRLYEIGQDRAAAEAG
jgi:arsenate reductase